MQLPYLSCSPAETEQYAERFAKTLRFGDVCYLFGDLGAGKTAFTRGLARGLGATAAVTSPTFGLLHPYPLPNGATLFHYDLYRLGGWDDLFDIGFEENIGFSVLEWSERLGEPLPPPGFRVTLKRRSDNEREIVAERISEATDG